MWWGVQGGPGCFLFWWDLLTTRPRVERDLWDPIGFQKQGCLREWGRIRRKIFCQQAFLFLAEACSMQDLSSLSRDQTRSPYRENVESFNYWTTRVVSSAGISDVRNLPWSTAVAYTTFWPWVHNKKNAFILWNSTHLRISKCKSFPSSIYSCHA